MAYDTLPYIVNGGYRPIAGPKIVGMSWDVMMSAFLLAYPMVRMITKTVKTMVRTQHQEGILLLKIDATTICTVGLDCYCLSLLLGSYTCYAAKKWKTNGS